MTTNFGHIFTREDGSYIITKNGAPYHVPNEGEWAEEWAAVDAYARANPDMATPEPELPAAPEPEPPTPEEQQAALQRRFTAAVQAYLDAFAQTRNYDGILSAATYATSSVPKFRAEGQYAVTARDAVWAKGYEILDDVLSGERPMPTIEEVIAELPELAWPE